MSKVMLQDSILAMIAGVVVAFAFGGVVHADMMFAYQTGEAHCDFSFSGCGAVGDYRYTYITKGVLPKFTAPTIDYVRWYVNPKGNALTFSSSGITTYSDEACTQVVQGVSFIGTPTTGTENSDVMVQGGLSSSVSLTGISCIGVYFGTVNYSGGLGQYYLGDPISAAAQVYLYSIATSSTLGEPYATSTPFSLSFGGFGSASSSFFGTAATSSIACDDSGNIAAWALCSSLSYLFVPSTAVLDQYAQVMGQLGTRFPFSWVTGTVDVIQVAASAAAIGTSTVAFNLHDAGIGSTTAVGNILPNITVFSQSTVKQYFPSGLWDAMQSLIKAALWLGLVFYLFFNIRNEAVFVGGRM